jgi:hypothetical protein
VCPVLSAYHPPTRVHPITRLAVRTVRASLLMLPCASCARAVELDSQISGGPTGFGGNNGTTAMPGATGSVGGPFGEAGTSSGGAGGGAGASTAGNFADSSTSGGNPIDRSLLDVARDETLDGRGGILPGPTGSCDPARWSVSASSAAPADPPVNAIDGNPATRWSTGTGQLPGEYYRIDFGGYVLLREVVLDNAGSPGDHPRGYLVESSNDGVDFSDVIAGGALVDSAPPLVVVDFAAQAVRFLRIELLTSSGSWWSVHELHTICQVPDVDGGG